MQGNIDIVDLALGGDSRRNFVVDGAVVLAGERLVEALKYAVTKRIGFVQEEGVCRGRFPWPLLEDAEEALAHVGMDTTHADEFVAELEDAYDEVLSLVATMVESAVPGDVTLSEEESLAWSKATGWRHDPSDVRAFEAVEAREAVEFFVVVAAATGRADPSYLAVNTKWYDVDMALLVKMATIASEVVACGERSYPRP